MSQSKIKFRNMFWLGEKLFSTENSVLITPRSLSSALGESSQLRSLFGPASNRNDVFLSLAIRATKTVFRRKLYMGRKKIKQDFDHGVEGGEYNVCDMCNMETNFPCEIAWNPLTTGDLQDLSGMKEFRGRFEIVREIIFAQTIFKCKHWAKLLTKNSNNFRENSQWDFNSPVFYFGKETH